MIQNKEELARPRRHNTDVFDKVSIVKQKQEIKLLPVEVVRVLGEGLGLDNGGTRFVSLTDFYLTKACLES